MVTKRSNPESMYNRLVVAYSSTEWEILSITRHFEALQMEHNGHNEEGISTANCIQFGQ